MLILKQPDRFFEEIREEKWRQPLFFLFQASAVIALFTPIVNYLGWPSTDLTSTYQAQIIAWRITQKWLLPRLGASAYVVEAFLIVALAVVIAAILAGLLHLAYRGLGGRGPLVHAWKAVCYGVAPCVLFGWIPYWTLFVGAWSFLLQLYLGPKVLYHISEGRALLILSFFLGYTLLEFAIRGTTVGI